MIEKLNSTEVLKIMKNKAIKILRETIILFLISLPFYLIPAFFMWDILWVLKIGQWEWYDRVVLSIWYSPFIILLIKYYNDITE